MKTLVYVAKMRPKKFTGQLHIKAIFGAKKAAQNAMKDWRHKMLKSHTKSVAGAKNAAQNAVKDW